MRVTLTVSVRETSGELDTMFVATGRFLIALRAPIAAQPVDEAPLAAGATGDSKSLAIAPATTFRRKRQRLCAGTRRR